MTCTNIKQNTIFSYTMFVTIFISGTQCIDVDITTAVIDIAKREINGRAFPPVFFTRALDKITGARSRYARRNYSVKPSSIFDCDDRHVLLAADLFMEALPKDILCRLEIAYKDDAMGSLVSGRVDNKVMTNFIMWIFGYERATYDLYWSECYKKALAVISEKRRESGSRSGNRRKFFGSSKSAAAEKKKQNIDNAAPAPAPAPTPAPCPTGPVMESRPEEEEDSEVDYNIE